MSRHRIVAILHHLDHQPPSARRFAIEWRLLLAMHRLRARALARWYAERN